jgi:hypothetical protein
MRISGSETTRGFYSFSGSWQKTGQPCCPLFHVKHSAARRHKMLEHEPPLFFRRGAAYSRRG